MKKRAQDILRDEKVFVGLEDSKKTWQLCVRSGGVIVHETSMPAKYEVLPLYLLHVACSFLNFSIVRFHQYLLSASFLDNCFLRTKSYSQYMRLPLKTVTLSMC
jgi:hypothetical protein